MGKLKEGKGKRGKGADGKMKTTDMLKGEKGSRKREEGEEKK